MARGDALVVVTDEMEDEIAASLIEQCSHAVCELLCCALSNTRHRPSDADIVVPESMDNWCLGLALVVVGPGFVVASGRTSRTSD